MSYFDILRTFIELVGLSSNQKVAVISEFTLMGNTFVVVMVLFTIVSIVLKVLQLTFIHMRNMKKTVLYLILGAIVSIIGQIVLASIGESIEMEFGEHGGFFANAASAIGNVIIGTSIWGL